MRSTIISLFAILISTLADASIVSPKKGASWDINTSHQIQWDTVGLQAPLQMHLAPGWATDLTSVIGELGSSVENSGAWTWHPQSPPRHESFVIIIVDHGGKMTWSDPFSMHGWPQQPIHETPTHAVITYSAAPVVTYPAAPILTHPAAPVLTAHVPTTIIELPVVTSVHAPIVFTSHPIIVSEHVVTSLPHPILQTEVLAPIIKTEIVAPVVRTELVAPIIKTEVVAPIIRTEIVAPILHTQILPPVIKTEHLAPLLTTEYLAPVVKTILVTETPAPIVKNHTLPPIIFTETQAPVVSTETPAPVIYTQEQPPIVITESQMPKIITETFAPVIQTEQPAPIVKTIHPPPVLVTQLETIHGAPVLVTQHVMPPHETVIEHQATLTAVHPAPTVGTHSAPFPVNGTTLVLTTAPEAIPSVTQPVNSTESTTISETLISATPATTRVPAMAVTGFNTSIIAASTGFVIPPGEFLSSASRLNVVWIGLSTLVAILIL